MIRVIAYIIGAVGGIWYVGFLAYKIDKLPYRRFISLNRPY
ncbi:MAG: hypothetical protein P8Y53_16670 [Pseudolabrys sp.]